jgi:hypothetical protein
MADAWEDTNSRAVNLGISPGVISDGFSLMAAKSRIISTDLHNTADALELLISAANGEESRSQCSTNVLPLAQANYSRPPTPDHTARPTDNDRCTDEKTWGQFLPIRKGILTKSELQEYLGFYWKSLWPLKPVIPLFYRDPLRYALLIEREPFLVQ